MLNQLKQATDLYELFKTEDSKSAKIPMDVLLLKAQVQLPLGSWTAMPGVLCQSFPGCLTHLVQGT